VVILSSSKGRFIVLGPWHGYRVKTRSRSWKDTTFLRQVQVYFHVPVSLFWTLVDSFEQIAAGFPKAPESSLASKGPKALEHLRQRENLKLKAQNRLASLKEAKNSEVEVKQESSHISVRSRDRMAGLKETVKCEVGSGEGPGYNSDVSLDFP